MAPVKVGDSVTNTTVTSEGWLPADAAALVTTSGELGEVAATVVVVEDVTGWIELEVVGGGPVAVTWTVVMMVVEISIVVAAPGWTTEVVAELPGSDWLAPLAGIGKILVEPWVEAEGAAPSAFVVEGAELAAAAVASATTLLEAEATLAVEAVELSRPRRDVFPLPTPTAGTLPFSFPDPEEEATLAAAAGDVTFAADDIEGPEVSVTLAAVAPVASVAATAVCVTWAEELNRDKRDVLPPPTPTAGTLPSSVPDPVAAARRGRLMVIGSRPGPTT
jgi:hypothetical protein